MNKLFIIGIIGLLAFSGVVLIENLNKEDIIGGIKMEEKIYQGPVPQGYDLEHFSKTGETIKLVNIKNPKTGEEWNSVEEYKNRNNEVNK